MLMSTPRYPHYLVLDLETAPDESAIPLLEETLRAPSHYKDPEKIAAFCAEKVARAALDGRCGRIVCLGTADRDGEEATVLTTEDEERAAIEALTTRWRTQLMPILVGKRFIQFDWPFLTRRAMVLGVEPPNLVLNKWANTSEYYDLELHPFLRADVGEVVLPLRLQVICRRLGIPVADPVTGGEIPALMAAGDYAAVRDHCLSDVRLTRALGQRLGVLAPKG